MSSDVSGVAQSEAGVQAATHALNIANSQGKVAASLVEQAAQQAGGQEEGKGEHVDEQA